MAATAVFANNTAARLHYVAHVTSFEVADNVTYYTIEVSIVNSNPNMGSTDLGSPTSPSSSSAASFPPPVPPPTPLSATNLTATAVVTAAGATDPSIQALSHSIKKRYSQFLRLHISLASKYPQLARFQMPGKEVLFSDREARKQVFDLYVKLLVSVCCDDEHVMGFLELNRLLDKRKQLQRTNTMATMRSMNAMSFYGVPTLSSAPHSGGGGHLRNVQECDIASDQSINGMRVVCAFMLIVFYGFVSMFVDLFSTNNASALSAANALLTATNQQSAETIKQLETELSNMRTKYDQLDLTFQQSEQQHTALLTSTNQQSAETLKFLETDLTQLRGKYDQLDVIYQQSQSQYTITLMELQQARSQLEEKNAKVTQMNEKLQSISGDKSQQQARVLELTEQLQVANAEKIELQAKINELTEKLKSFTVDATQQQSKIDELESMQAKLQTRNAEQLTKVNNLQMDVNEKTNLLTNLTRSKQSLEEINAQLVDKQGKLQTSHSEQTIRLTSVQAELTDKTNQVTTLTHSKQSLEESNAQLSEKQQSLQADLHAALSMVAALELKLAEANNRITAVSGAATATDKTSENEVEESYVNWVLKQAEALQIVIEVDTAEPNGVKAERTPKDVLAVAVKTLLTNVNVMRDDKDKLLAAIAMLQEQQAHLEQQLQQQQAQNESHETISNGAAAAVDDSEYSYLAASTSASVSASSLSSDMQDNRPPAVVKRFSIKMPASSSASSPSSASADLQDIKLSSGKGKRSSFTISSVVRSPRSQDNNNQFTAQENRERTASTHSSFQMKVDDLFDDNKAQNIKSPVNHSSSRFSPDGGNGGADSSGNDDDIDGSSDDGDEEEYETDGAKTNSHGSFVGSQSNSFYIPLLSEMAHALTNNSHDSHHGNHHSNGAASAANGHGNDHHKPLQRVSSRNSVLSNSSNRSGRAPATGASSSSRTSGITTKSSTSTAISSMSSPRINAANSISPRSVSAKSSPATAATASDSANGKRSSRKPSLTPSEGGASNASEPSSHNSSSMSLGGATDGVATAVSAMTGWIPTPWGSSASSAESHS
jgi:chromosome segregation ATPase